MYWRKPTKSKLISIRSQVLYHFVCLYGKHVKKVSFRKIQSLLGIIHILKTIAILDLPPMNMNIMRRFDFDV